MPGRTTLAPASRSVDVLVRHHVTVSGAQELPTVVLVHGFGSDQTVWQPVVQQLGSRYRVVRYDLAGAGRSDVSAYDRSIERHGTLHGHAQDLLDVCDAHGLRGATLVGHSVSATVVALAAAARPDLASGLVLVAPSARYLDDPETGYVGGFSVEDVAELLVSLRHNYLAWSAVTAPMIMGNADRPELGERLAAAFCRTDPGVAAHFAQVLFTSDHRDDLAAVRARTLTLQCRHDALAPPSAVGFVHDSVPGSTLLRMDASGHCPHVSAPAETARAIVGSTG
ncbi:alpha/beta fold hydrolase [Aquipuribacter hungaricus]|uniref:alpha/beta fold hydrolase n=1 Tax=Aquipuribacter hungaricus TaxID=545624 RepID=UPI0030EEDF1F